VPVTEKLIQAVVARRRRRRGVPRARRQERRLRRRSRRDPHRGRPAADARVLRRPAAVVPEEL